MVKKLQDIKVKLSIKHQLWKNNFHICLWSPHWSLPQTPSMHLGPRDTVSGLNLPDGWMCSWENHDQKMEPFTVRYTWSWGGAVLSPTGTFCLGAGGASLGLLTPLAPYATRGLTVTLDEKLSGDGITDCGVFQRRSFIHRYIIHQLNSIIVYLLPHKHVKLVLEKALFMLI